MVADLSAPDRGSPDPIDRFSEPGRKRLDPFLGEDPQPTFRTSVSRQHFNTLKLTNQPRLSIFKGPPRSPSATIGRYDSRLRLTLPCTWEGGTPWAPLTVTFVPRSTSTARPARPR